jgi:hypothetical protein
MKKLKTYEAPTTRVAKVTLKTSMLAGSIMESAESKVETSEHETGTDIDFGGSTSASNGDFTVTGWE